MAEKQGLIGEGPQGRDFSRLHDTLTSCGVQGQYLLPQPSADSVRIHCQPWPQEEASLKMEVCSMERCSEGCLETRAGFSL